MCGIAGFVQEADSFDDGLIDRLLETVRHRGPDAMGHFASRRGVIGQTRLSIIDVVGGDPPLTCEDGSIGAVLNGEIYNFRRLQKELLDDGHRLESQCDTEVLAHLAESEDSISICRRVDGMFAFAIWDTSKEQLILGRDRFGKKPLYYWHDDETLVFGSEIKVLFEHPRVTASLDADAIPAFLVFGYVPTPRTFFRGIQSLPPGHVLTYRVGGQPQISRYWDSAPPSDETKIDKVTLDERAAELRLLLMRAVERRLVADVPLGAFLSGGIDSATVVGLMTELSEEPVRTFSIGFDDGNGFDERPYSRMVAGRFGTEHTEFVVRPQAIDLIENLVWHYDQPFGDSSAIPTYLLAERTRSKVTVALSGDGGDELFAGYSRFPASMALERYKALPSATRKATGLLIRGAHRLLPRGDSALRLLDRAELSTPEALISWITYSKDDLTRSLAERSSWAVEDFIQRWSSTSGSLLHRLLWVNRETYLLDDLLPKTDRMSMAHGLEVRSPFLDPELLEFTSRLPEAALVSGFTMKRILRRAVSDLVPREILSRPKRGFAVPLARWMREDLRPFVTDHLGSPRARVREHVRSEVLDELLTAHLSGKRDYADLLWALLTLEVFLRKRQW